MGCVRFLGTFLTDMNHIPSGVRHLALLQIVGGDKLIIPFC
nr:DUF4158 domain-containing protein [Klebsiella pneumoniae]